MEIKGILTAAIIAAANKGIEDGVFPEAQLPDIVLEVPPKKEMGDFATNFAMQSARAFHKNPRQIAQDLIDRLEIDELDKAGIAGQGLMNF